MMEGKALLISALAKCQGQGDYEELEGLLSLHTSRSDEFNLREIADFMTDSEHDSLWKELCKFSAILVEALEVEQDEDENDGDAAIVEGAEEFVQSLRRIAGVMTLYIVDTPKCRPDALFETLQIFHGLLMTLNDDIPFATVLKNAVARCCEAWWVKEEAGAENICNQLIPFLLLSALGPSTMDVDVKRCWTIRGALILLDFDDPSIEQLRGLLMRCVIHSGFLKVTEGRRFLSFLFSINANLAQLIVSVMKPQIAAGMKGVASAYGAVIYRAWKDAETAPELQATIEESIQSLAHDTIHASDRKYFRGLRFVLGAFHENKRIKGVDSMLLRVYGPILWRSLRCANALVRAQGTMLFFDAFPLQDSDASTVESDAVLQKQFDLLSSLLRDVDHRVRAAAVSGVFHILEEYWEALPLQTTRQILSYVVGTLGQDSSCSEVRLVVVQGLCNLLDQPLAHGILGGLLPLLSNAIHDNAEKVRVAFIHVLDKVKNIKNITYYDIVSEERLFARLAVDAARPAVATAMTKLLLNSFYPREENGSSSVQSNLEQKNRCIQFIGMNTDAAVAFYAQLHKFISVGSATKFCAMMFAILRQPVASVDHENNKDDDDDHYEAASAPSHPLAARAKRRRNQELAKRSEASEASQTNSVPKPDALEMKTRIGILRVILSCFSGIADKLKLDIHEPSRELLTRHITTEAVADVFRSVEPTEMNMDVESLPILLKFIALVNNLLLVGIEEEPQEDVEMAVIRPSMLSFESIIASFATAWSNIDTDESLDQIARRTKLEQQAMACADVLYVLGKTDDLLSAIRAPFQTLEKNLIAVRSKNSGPKKAESNALCLGAAVELMSAIVDSSDGSTYALKAQILGGRETNDFFAYIFSVAQKAAAGMAYTVLGPKAETLTAKQLLRCIHMNASVAVTRLTLDSADSASLEEFVLWMSSTVIASISDQFYQTIVLSIMALFSDCLMLDVATKLISTVLESWSATLLRHVKGSDDQDGVTLPYLVPIIGRICAFAMATKRKDRKDCTTFDNSNNETAFSNLLEILLRHLSVTGEDGDDWPAKRFVDRILNYGSPCALSTATRFIIANIKTIKKRSGESMRIEDDNALLALEVIKEGPHLSRAFEYAQKQLLGDDDKAILLLTDLFSCAKDKPALQKELHDKLLENNKENGGAVHAKLMHALRPLVQEGI